MSGLVNDPNSGLNRFLTVKNADSTDYPIGTVLVWANMTMMTVTVTTTDGDIHPAGVVAFNTLSAGKTGFIQTWGYHAAVLISEDLTVDTFMQTSDTPGEAKGGTLSVSKTIGIALETNTPGATSCKTFLKIGPGSDK